MNFCLNLFNRIYLIFSKAKKPKLDAQPTGGLQNTSASKDSDVQPTDTDPKDSDAQHTDTDPKYTEDQIETVSNKEDEENDQDTNASTKNMEPDPKNADEPISPKQTE